MSPSLSASELESLRRIDACLMANVIESFGVRLRNEGFADGSIRSLFPRLAPMVGHAVTVKIRGSSPPTGSGHYLDRTDWWDYVLSVPGPRIAVVEDVGSQPGLGALLGEVHVNILRTLGCVGAVTNGSVRDLAAAESLGFPLFAGSLSVSHSYVHIVDTGTPVTIGGLTVRSGDLLHGDRHGIQSIPLQIAAAIPTEAARQLERERAVIALCRSPGFSLEKLRALIAASSR